MKMKILFMLINMNVGGTEKALLNMINEIPKDQYEITILMLEKYGEFLNSIPKHVHIEYLKGYSEMKSILNQAPHITALNYIKSGKFLRAINVLYFHFFTKNTGERSSFYKYVLRETKNIEIKYDIAVAYAGPMDFISYFIVNKIIAKKKIQWIHFDVTKIGFNQKFATKMYRNFDKILVVSEEGKKKLIELLPNLKDKTDTFFNVVSRDDIKLLACKGKGFEDNFKGIRILTVGRLAKEKGQDLAIPVLARLKSNGFNVRWYCVGEGNAREEYETIIEQYGVKDDFILMGMTPNPYPFMKQCDIYVQPSRHEGYCITIAEAKCFNKPIVSTNFTGAAEQIIHDHTGLIVDFKEQQMYEGIKRLIEDQNLKSRLEESKLDFQSSDNNNKDIGKLINIFAF